MILNDRQKQILQLMYDTDTDLYINQPRQCGLSTILMVFAVMEATEGKTVLVLCRNLDYIDHHRKLVDKNLYCSHLISENNKREIKFHGGGRIKFHILRNGHIRGYEIDDIISLDIDRYDNKLCEFIWQMSPALAYKENERGKIFITETTNNNFTIEDAFKRERTQPKIKTFIKSRK
jgi:hypothetical protein